MHDPEEILHSGAILKHLPVGFILTDRSGTCIHVNPRWSELTGCPPEEASGDGWMAALHPRDRKEVSREWSAASREDRAFRLEFRFRHPDQTTVWVLGHAEPIVEDGRTTARIGTIFDISDRKRAEKRRNELISVVSHEIRGPLASIHGALSYLQNERSLAEDEKQKLREMALRNSGFLAHLVDDLLVFERLEADRMDLLLEETSLESVVARAVEMTSMRAGALPERIEVQVQEGALLCDRRRLIQVLSNLVDNALKFSESDQRVTVTGTIENDEAVFTVQDRGRGIPLEDLETIFRPFEQVTSDDQNRLEGTGLGLAISRAIVERHGGSIRVESQPNHGTTFAVRVPVSGPDPTGEK